MRLNFSSSSSIGCASLLADTKNASPFAFMLAKLTDLLRDSKIEVVELLQEIRHLQEDLKEKIRERKYTFGKEYDYAMHDMKNAFSGMLACADVLRHGELEPADRQELLQLIQGEMERIVRLAGECHKNGVPLSIRPASIAKFLDTFVPFLRHHLFANRNITLQINMQYRGCIRIDLEKMEQAFLNIVYNARDAMPDGGTLTIATKRINAMVCIEFTDTGCGMSPELQAHFLEPFVTSGKPSGTGLGMAIVKEILDAHHGRIEVESAVNAGTTIRLCLPVK
ncbi:integral membrane sensor signal transduction histidine kinase [Candidatus Moduliflexus flocculans]|uniref:histidine kinase n=1 Tax=Candidatus Moduliflexus flocculans TaxID=1499966 RepID=A0A0S6W3Z5_9BACT|nr:integral membrane sensor signal transduction histidine kinase [Candidatus Moduliflexus flocculans]